VTAFPEFVYVAINSSNVSTGNCSLNRLDLRLSLLFIRWFSDAESAVCKNLLYFSDHKAYLNPLICSKIESAPYIAYQNDEDTRIFCGKFLYNAIASTDNEQHKNCPSSGNDDRPGRNLFRVLKRSSISQGSRQHDRTPTKIASALEKFPATVIIAERLARLKQVPIFKVLALPGRDSNHTNNELPDMKRAL